MSSEFGKLLKVQIFGESHGAGIGAVVDGLPCGETVDLDELNRFMQRRAGGKAFSTARREADEPKFLSGLRGGTLTGAPLAFVIENNNARPADYSTLVTVPRPSHADYPAMVKYRGAVDLSGGGHFSGRLTAPLCTVGGIAKQLLARRGIFVGAHIDSIAGIPDRRYDPLTVTRDELETAASREFPVLDETAGERMREAIEAARADCDSVGGVVECAVIGLPTGLGEPLYDGIENRLSATVFGIGAVRGIEFGDGFAACSMRGSQHNDGYVMRDGGVAVATNHAGGVLGGMTTGAPIVFRVGFKPTPSIAKPQRSVDLATGKEVELTIPGRHDPCIVPRAVPCVEAAAACVLLDFILATEDKKNGTR